MKREKKEKKIKPKKENLNCSVKPGLFAGKKMTHGFKIVAGAICGVVAVLIVIVVVTYATAAKGEKYAENAAEYIGNGVDAVNARDDMHFRDESAYYGVNSAVQFDYVYESDKSIKASGVSYPTWAVFLEMSDEQFITDVTFTDYTVIKKDLRGVKNSGLINLDTFKKGSKRSAVLKYIGIDPYSIKYSQTGIITYTFRYFYTRDNGDEQQMILRAVFDEDGKYQYYTDEIVYPDI